MHAWLQCLEDKQPFTIEYRVSKPWYLTDPISGEELRGDTWYVEEGRSKSRSKHRDLVNELTTNL